jgi:hypothetical protein
VATGTGWAARRVAARGATVIGIDIAADLIAAAKAGAAEAGVQADFRVADAEKLPYENHSFDAIISTFGVMFVREGFRNGLGIAMPRDYLVTIGVRKELTRAGLYSCSDVAMAETVARKVIERTQLDGAWGNALLTLSRWKAQDRCSIRYRFARGRTLRSYPHCYATKYELSLIVHRFRDRRTL